MKVFTAVGAIHIQNDDTFACSFVAGVRIEPAAPAGTVFLIPVYRDGDIVRDARTHEELARRIGVITNIGEG